MNTHTASRGFGRGSVGRGLGRGKGHAVRGIRITLYLWLALWASCSAQSIELDQLNALSQPYQLME
jgi:hypothetical protein